MANDPGPAPVERQFVWDQGKPPRPAAPVVEPTSNGWYDKWRAEEPPGGATEPFAVTRAQSYVKPLTFGKVVWAVFVGNLLFGIVGALVYAALTAH